jgi:hypothetical protein
MLNWYESHLLEQVVVDVIFWQLQEILSQFRILIHLVLIKTDKTSWKWVD